MGIGSGIILLSRVMSKGMKSFKDSSNSPLPKGFTLLELMIAIFIIAVIISILYTSYAGTFRNIDEAKAQTDIYRMARIALERITQDLESAYMGQGSKKPGDDHDSPPYPGIFIGETVTFEGRASGRLRFSSSAHVDFLDELKAHTRAEIAYYSLESGPDKRLVLYRSDSREFDLRPKENEGGLPICENLLFAEFIYHNHEGETFENWDSTAIEFKNRLPLMVTIKLDFSKNEDQEVPLRFITAVTIPLARDMHDENP